MSKRVFEMDLNPSDRVETVSEFTERVKQVLEREIRPCWVAGEISNLRRQSSGHTYFSLKDADSQISAVLFRGDAIRQQLQLRDGMQVVAFGEISVYPPRGSYQLIVRHVLEAGVGRLQQEFELLKKKLAAEGLFEPERKLPIPLIPSAIGFITSSGGAAAQDFIRILKRRGWRGRVVILPSKVQGKEAAKEMIALLDYVAEASDFDLV
ncbi:MAG: exodeoxyribonuclease VII large subunit, partial [Opitutales bacterium]